MNYDYIFNIAGMNVISVSEFLRGRLIMPEDAKKLLDYAKANNSNFLDFKYVEFIDDNFVEELIRINPNIIVIGIGQLILEKYSTELNVLIPHDR